MELGELGEDLAAKKGKRPEQVKGSQAVWSHHPFWKKPTKAVLVRVVHPLADPEDGDAGGILGLLWTETDR